MRNAANTLGIVHTGIAATYLALGWWNFHGWAVGLSNGAAAASWYSFADYMDDGIDYDHAILIGASHVKKKKILWWYKKVTVADDHDGVIPVSSQLLPTERGTTVIHGDHTITGVNHMEEFNHGDTKREFQKALAGYYNPAFKK